MSIVASIVLFVAVAGCGPLLFARGALRRRLATADIGVSALALALWLVLPRLGISLPLDVAFAAFIVAKLGVFFAILAAHHDSDELGWAPWRFGLFAGAVFLALIPFVLRGAIDGDEPFYLLMTESIVRDHDLDLRNQYADLAHSATRRRDLAPQFGDPVGPRGEQYSRHEPMLAILLVPGVLAGGLGGAVATIAIFAALAVWSIARLLDDEGISRRVSLVVLPFVAFGPPLFYYATRIWPEALAALLFSEAIRAARRERRAWLAVVILLLSLLKIRFAAVGISLLAAYFLSTRASKARAFLVATILLLPAAALIFLYPEALLVRAFDPADVFTPTNMVRGMLGVLIDAQAGLLFQAPLFFAGLFVLLRWKSLAPAARLAFLSALPYLLLLVPRSEWHGGWSPPLRYLVVFVPLFALLAAAALEHLLSRGVVALSALWTAGLIFEGLAHPDRLFHIENGESVVGEWLSRVWGSDFSSLLPSLIRPNEAAMVAAGVLAALAVAVALFARRQTNDSASGRGGAWHAAALASVVIALASWAGREPAKVVELEDAHVRHSGGSLYPERWTVARFRFRGGWAFTERASASFLYGGGKSVIEYSADAPAALEIEGTRVDLPATGGAFRGVEIDIRPTRGRLTMRCVKGALIVDRLAAK